jgi:hypothetical protein
VNSLGMFYFLVQMIGVIGLVCEAATWTAATNAPSGSWRGMAMSTSGQFVAASQQGGGIYYSSDYGASWTASNAASRNYVYMGGSDNGQYLIAAVHNAGLVWYSGDYGHTWTASNTPSGYWHGVAVSGNGQYALACFVGGQVWRFRLIGLMSGWITLVNMQLHLGSIPLQAVSSIALTMDKRGRATVLVKILVTAS